MSNVARSVSLGVVVAAMLLCTGVAAADTPAPEPDESATASASPAPEESPEDSAEQTEEQEATKAEPDAESADLVWNCREYSYLGYADVTCGSGISGARFRAWAHCDGAWWFDDYNRAGGWVGVGGRSEVRCDSGDTVIDVWHEGAVPVHVGDAAGG
jgi:hypothetical protein